MREKLVRYRFWVILGLIAFAVAAGSLQGGDDGLERPAGRSSLDEGSGGFAAWAELAAQNGLEVDRRFSPPSRRGLDSDATVVAVDLGTLSRQDIEALQEHLDDGGRLVFGGTVAPETVARIAGFSPLFARDDSDVAESLVLTPETRGVQEVTGFGDRWGEAGPGLPLLGTPERPLLLRIDRQGGGELLLIADTAPLRNAQIADSGNALFAVNLLRGDSREKVQFLESVQPATGEAGQGLGAIPDEWRYCFFGLLLAGVVFISSRLRRLGPPDGSWELADEPRVGYINAMGRMLARSGSIRDAAEPVRLAVLRRIGTSPELPRDSGGDKLAERARAAGLPADEAEALAGPIEDTDAAIKAARALSRVWR